MRGLGIVTTIVLVAGASAAVALGVVSRDDLQRYLKMRRM